MELGIPLELAGRRIEFLLDTKAAYSDRVGLLSSCNCMVVDTDGQPKVRQLSFLAYETEFYSTTNLFSHVPECPAQILGRDLLPELEATVFLKG